MTVRQIDVREIPQASDVKEQVQHIIDDEEYQRRLEKFEEWGRKTRQMFMNADFEVANDHTITSVGYAIATFDTPTAQVDEKFEKYVDEPGDIEGLKAVIAETAHGETGIEWFKKIIEAGTEDVTVAYQRGDTTTAHEKLEDKTGFGGTKTPMPSLLLGFEGAWVMDTNVIAAATDYLKKVADLGHLPKCEPCWNAANDPRWEPKPLEGDFFNRRIWTKQPYFTNHHLSDHLQEPEHYEAYRDPTVRLLNERHSQDLSARSWTQVLFNVGQHYTVGKSEEDRQRFDIHAPFYELVTEA